MGQQFARMCGDANLAQVMASHPEGDNPPSDRMFDIPGSSSWRQLHGEGGEFPGDKRCRTLSLEMDGISPFHCLDSAYSMTPITLTLLNLPRNVCQAFGNIIVAGIIPGERDRTGEVKRASGESSNLDIFVEILVDELLSLMTSAAVKDYARCPVNVKVKLPLHILDYKGMCKLFIIHGTGAIRGRAWCRIQGSRCRHLNKVVYLVNRG